MYSRKWICIFLAVLAFVFPVKNFAQSIPYNKIVFFGDSLTDNGNLYKSFFKIIPKSPPYFQGQFSNGPVWSEDMGAYFHTYKNDVGIENYAVGGETAVWHNPMGGFLPYVLSESINNYISASDTSDKTQTLYFMWIGGNDYLHGDDDVNQSTSDVVQVIRDSLEKLVSNGGKHFIVMNLPNLSRVPEGRDGGRAQNIFDLTITHNAKLTNMVTQLQLSHPSIDIRMFDTFAIMNQLLDDPASMNHQYHTHVSNTYNSCWGGGYTLNQKHMEYTLDHQLKAGKSNLNATMVSQYIMNSPDLQAAYNVAESYSRHVAPCADPDSYVFWDKVHPTAVVHRMMSESIIHFISND